VADNVPAQTEPRTENDLIDLLRQLSSSQLRFVSKRVWTDTDADAARELGISPSTVKNWKQDGAPLDETVRLMKHDGVIMAAEMLRRSLADAVEVKIGGLLDRSSSIRQAAATEIIDRNMGKAVQRQEIEGQVTVVWQAGESNPFAVRPAVDNETT